LDRLQLHFQGQGTTHQEEVSSALEHLTKKVQEYATW